MRYTAKGVWLLCFVYVLATQSHFRKTRLHISVFLVWSSGHSSRASIFHGIEVCPQRELFWAYMLYGNLLIKLLTILRTISKSHFFLCFLCSCLLKCSNSFSPFCTLHTHPVHTLSRFPYTTTLINR